MTIETDLFSFAYIPAWLDQLDVLANMCLPESWRFRSPTYLTKNADTPILERYLKTVFRKQAIEYMTASNPHEADQVFYVRNETACFHTGLYTKHYKGIYMCFTRNKRKDTLIQWYFRGWAEDSSQMLLFVEPLPQKPAFLAWDYALGFYPEWEIRVNVSHILEDAENVARLPESLKAAWNLPLLLETAVELGRRLAVISPSLVVPQAFQGRVQFLIPIYLTNMNRPDLAMTLSDMAGYYIGHTCLTLEMAYLNARLLARPTATWLTGLVEKSVEEERKENVEGSTLPSVQGEAV